MFLHLIRMRWCASLYVCEANASYERSECFISRSDASLMLQVLGFQGLFLFFIVKNYLGGRVLPENAGVVIFLSICYTIFRSKAEITVIM